MYVILYHVLLPVESSLSPLVYSGFKFSQLEMSELHTAYARCSPLTILPRDRPCYPRVQLPVRALTGQGDLLEFRRHSVSSHQPQILKARDVPSGLPCVLLKLRICSTPLSFYHIVQIYIPSHDPIHARGIVCAYVVLKFTQSIIIHQR